ncbi:MAG: 50S ribosomal protein L14 [Candidatus Aenigmarchaeota archaeon]|nr:50S ribosomal protein L14 [Candidatus Aenigmarchaeota archaeon]
MKPISAKVPHSLQVGSYLKCVDNTGAKELQIIAVKGYKGVKKRIPGCGVGGFVVCAVKKGDPKIKHEVVHALIVRQHGEFRRPNGMRVRFEDNAAVIVNEKGEPRGTRIKTPIAKEAVERFSMVGKIASAVL